MSERSRTGFEGSSAPWRSGHLVILPQYLSPSPHPLFEGPLHGISAICTVSTRLERLTHRQRSRLVLVEDAVFDTSRGAREYQEGQEVWVGGKCNLKVKDEFRKRKLAIVALSKIKVTQSFRFQTRSCQSSIGCFVDEDPLLLSFLLC